MTDYQHALAFNIGANRQKVSEAARNVCDELHIAEDIVYTLCEGQLSSDSSLAEARKAAAIIDGTSKDFKEMWKSWYRLRSIATRLTYPPEIPILNVCPFCGNDPVVMCGDVPSYVWDGEITSQRIYSVACSCGARTAICNDPLTAANVWNMGLHTNPGRYLFPKIRGTDDIIRTSAFMDPGDTVKG